MCNKTLETMQSVSLQSIPIYSIVPGANETRDITYCIQTIQNCQKRQYVMSHFLGLWTELKVNVISSFNAVSLSFTMICETARRVSPATGLPTVFHMNTASHTSAQYSQWHHQTSCLSPPPWTTIIIQLDTAHDLAYHRHPGQQSSSS